MTKDSILNTTSDKTTSDYYLLSLEIKDTREGLGNAGDKKQYHYIFHPDEIILQPKNDKIQVTFSKDSVPHCRFIGYAKEQTDIHHLIDDTVSIDGRTMTVPSPYECGSSYYLTMILRDDLTNKKIYCDPQVRNSPPPRS